MTGTPVPPAGFTDFVAARSSALLRVAWALTGDTGRAEDLLQVALARCWRRWSQIADGNPEAYARRVLFTTYLTWWRRQWRGEIPSAAPPERSTGADPATDLAADVAARDALRRALAGLTRRQRAVVVLRFVEDRSVAETAEMLGCSQGTVKTLSSRALAALRADPGIRSVLTVEV